MTEEKYGRSAAYYPLQAGQTSVDITVYLALGESDIYNVTKFEMDGLVTAAYNKVADSRASASTYDTLKAINDYLCNAIKYNTAAADESSTKYTAAERKVYQTAYSAFAKCNGDTEIQTVCAGYAKAFKILCDRFGIPCVIISGTGTNSQGNTEAHAWNAVQLDGEWYAVDVTWNDQNDDGDDIIYDYFLVGSDTFNTNHTTDGDFIYPELSNTKYEATTPDAPTDLKVTEEGDGQVTLTWTAVDNATSYNVYQDGNPIATGITGTSYTVKGLTNDATYSFTVAAVNDAGEGDKSTPVSATPKAETTATVPAAPTDLEATDGDKQITLTWTAVDNATSYNIYQKYQNNGDTPIATGITDTSYTVTELTNGTEYSFYVKAVNDAGESAPSGTVKATPTAETTVTTLPAPDLMAIPAADVSVGLYWTAVDGATGYNVYVNDYLAGCLGADANETTYKDLSLSGKIVPFAVAAVKDGEEGARATETVMVAAKPAVALVEIPEVTATPGDGTVTLTWSPIKDIYTHTITRYIVYQDGMCIALNLVPETTVSGELTYTVTGLKNGTEYKFQVAGIGDLVGNPSDPVSATPTALTPPAAPTITETKPTDTTVELKWSEVAGATYKVYKGEECLTPNGISATNYTFTGLEANTQYTFSVSAVVNGVESTLTKVDIKTNETEISLPTPGETTPATTPGETTPATTPGETITTAATTKSPYQGVVIGTTSATTTATTTETTTTASRETEDLTPGARAELDGGAVVRANSSSPILLVILLVPAVSLAAIFGKRSRSGRK